MNILFIISLLFTAAVAQEPSLSCNYNLFGMYGCDLTINNPNGFDNFTEIGGIHLEGFGNENVTEVYRISGVSSNVPSIICDTFPNLLWITLYGTGLTEVGDRSFSGCSRITRLSLYVNTISSISPNAFVTLPDLIYLLLDDNMISTLPENVFASQQNLTDLDLSNNPFNDIPSGVFRPLQNLRYLYLSNANISAINNEWFANNDNLDYLYMTRNRITLSAGNFEGLTNLRTLNLGSNLVNEVPVGTFAGLPNLQTLYLYGNNFTELPEDSFPDLGQLTQLDISENQIEVIHDGAFRGLFNLSSLIMSSCRLGQVQAHYFDDLGHLTSLNLNFNDIEELPVGVFAVFTNLNYIGLWGNRLKTIRRNSFGTLTSVQTIDLDDNVVNAVDRAIIDDAVNLDGIYFGRNLCASGYFGSFVTSRAQHLLALARCFRNALYIVDAVTEAGEEYSFFEGPQPGIALRVNTGNDTSNEVQIALTPFNFIWTPIIEILIGTTNNTRSAIRVNQETNVVTVPTPNIIVQDQWNDFRITWANQVILVFSGNNTYPFMGFTMQDFFPINFYGLRAAETRATWTIQPLE